MKIEIQQITNDPANSLLHVYAGSTRPICSIYEEDFSELLTQKQLEKFVDGGSEFDVSKFNLLQKAKTIYEN